jgi:hypothetical protein
MNKIIAVLFLMLFATSLQAKDKPNPADYTIKVHISASHMQWTFYGWKMYADATLNGRKVELAGDAVGIGNHAAEEALVIPGDYQARLTSEFHNSDSTAIHQVYDILLTDGLRWHCMISGLSE